MYRYGVTYGGHATKAKNSQKVQKRAIRIITGEKYNEYSKPLFKKYNIMTIVWLFGFTNLVNVKENLKYTRHT